MGGKTKIPIGIDLGTTNSAVAVWWQEKVELVRNREGTRINPSYVHYNDDKEKRVGRMAREKGAIDPKRVLFDAKRLLATTINDKNIVEFRSSWPFNVDCKPDDPLKRTYYKISDDLYIPPEEVSSCILKSLLSDVCRWLDNKPDEIEAVITVPAYFNMTQKRATLRAAELAKLKVRQLLPEPVAAALCYQSELNFDDGEIIFTFDLE
uniref:Heat shock protein 70 n=1 Tax=Panagrolaimus sp. JU765 TaxID=591449 RepID=A0AC34RGZ4_9BILA